MAKLGSNWSGYNFPQLTSLLKNYSMDEDNMGLAVIVNNASREFSESNKDVEALEVAFETLGFKKPKIHNDCTYEQMKEIRRDIVNSKDHEESNMFVLAVIAHGDEDGFLLEYKGYKEYKEYKDYKEYKEYKKEDKEKKTEDTERAWQTDKLIAEIANIQGLLGKPKLFVIQSCRGQGWNSGRAYGARPMRGNLPVATIQRRIPNQVDIFVAYAAVPGYKAATGLEHYGSHYIQALAHYLKTEYMNQPLDRIYLGVKEYMKNVVQDGTGIMQGSEERNSLTQVLDFSLFHKKDKRNQRKLASEKKVGKEIGAAEYNKKYRNHESRIQEFAGPIFASGRTSTYGTDVQQPMSYPQTDLGPNRKYPMSLSKLGCAVIVNNLGSQYPETLKTVNAQNAAFTRLGFECHHHINCDARDMMKIRQFIYNEDTHNDCNVCLITIVALGNGTGYIMDTNGMRSWLIRDLVEELSRVGSLVGKPKIIIVVSANTFPPEVLPNGDDTFLVYASGGTASDPSSSLTILANTLSKLYSQHPLDRIFLYFKNELQQKFSNAIVKEKDTLRYELDFSLYQK